MRHKARRNQTHLSYRLRVLSTCRHYCMANAGVSVPSALNRFIANVAVTTGALDRQITEATPPQGWCGLPAAHAGCDAPDIDQRFATAVAAVRQKVHRAE